MESLLIVDGNNLLFQMFYGMPSKIYNKSGQTIHATIGFISAIMRLIKLVDASKVIVVFDEDGSEERKQEYQDYKANRINNWDELPANEVPFNEEDKIIKCLSYMKIKVLKSKDMEADDLIASLALTYKEEYKVFISSYDSDFFQLIDDNVSIIKYKGKNTNILTKEEFVNLFRFTPNKYVFYKSLVGDNADNIKGITGIGKVRATKIVNDCECFEELLEKSQSLLPIKICERLHLEKETFFINKKIITLTKKYFVNYDIGEYGFDKGTLSLTNSEILSINKVFD